MYRRNIKPSKKKYHELFNIFCSNPRKLRNSVLPKSSNHIIHVTDANGDRILESDCPGVFNDHFSSIIKNECLDSLSILLDKTYEPMLRITVNYAGIRNLIDKLKLTSSAVLNNINSKFKKNTSIISSECLKLIVTKSLL